MRRAADLEVCEAIMCGITGFIDRSIPDLQTVCGRMTEALRHRGPDDRGYWADPDRGVALGHRRLSIVDLSAAGHQPMLSANGRFVIAFNGEIYNHLKVRRELEADSAAVSWRGHSDTETLLAAMQAWGVPKALRRSVGMFALAVWDRERCVLTLARDRLGEKPLYFGAHGSTFFFASELKAIAAHPSFRGVVDRGALAMFLRFNYVPEPQCIYEKIEKLLPGTFLEIDANGSFASAVEYWAASEIARLDGVEPFRGSDVEALAGLETVLGDAIAGQMVADVPLGAFLSGGIDSSAVVALMQERSLRPIRTFTIGFSESAYDEAPYAKAVARHLGTDHNELYVTSSEALDVVPRLPTIYDEPFADSSQIPTFLVSQMARRHVTVSLSGDGGDELFGGYVRYTWAKRVWGMVDASPRLLRKLLVRLIRAVPADSWSAANRGLASRLPPRLRVSNLGHKLYRFAELLGSPSRDRVYKDVVSHWPAPADVVVGALEPRSRLDALMARPIGRSFEEAMMFWDLSTYLPGDILVKVDRAAMATSLETRVPMLDHRVVEFAWTLPLRMRIRDGQGKWLLRQLLYKRVPRHLVDRTKMGFGIPIDSWLRGPLREWAEDLLDEKRLTSEGFFQPLPIRQRWHEQISERRNWGNLLWGVLMFQAWHSHQ